MNELFSTDPYDPVYYFPIIIGLFIILGLCQLFIMYLSHNTEDNNLSFNQSLSVNSDYSLNFITNKNSLRFRYVCAYLLMRASVWAKSPYIWSMYLYYHKFTVSEIGVLYVIDGISALVFGPIIGNLTDMFGRKRFCQLYNLSVCLNLALRLSGSHSMAYIAQIVTGIGAGLANTSFESWVVSESIKEFQNYEHEREKFLKKLFKTTNMFDACLSIVISAMSAIVYVSQSLYTIYAYLQLYRAYMVFSHLYY
jgi:MFS family permease